MGRLLRFLAWVARYGPRVARRLAQLHDELDAAKIALDVLMRAAARAKSLGQTEREFRHLGRAAEQEQLVRDLTTRIRRLKAGRSETL